jgi:titin
MGIDDSGDMVGFYYNSHLGIIGFMFSNANAAPVAPTNFAAGDSQANPQNVINLYWRDNSNDESGFQIFRSLDRGISFTQLTTVGPNTVFFQDTGLSPFTSYYYYVKAFNSVGTSGASNTDWTITAEATNGSGPAPSAPTQVAAGQDRSNPGTQIDVYWQGNVSTDTGYQVFRSPDGVTFQQIATVPVATTIYPNYAVYPDSGLTPGTTYFYYVKAYNAAGASAPSNIDWTITAP